MRAALPHATRRHAASWVKQQLADKVVERAVMALSEVRPTTTLPVGTALDHMDSPTIDIPEDLDAADLVIAADPQSEGQLRAVCALAPQVDPFALVKPELGHLADNVKAVLGSDHPVLSRVAKYFFELDGGKKIRPAMVLLMAHAMQAGSEVGVSPQQRRLAEITEMIHTASLLHDDVIDMADKRRGVDSANQVFGNTLAVLSGDFLLARASVCLARLRNLQVVEVLSTVIAHLVKGEVMQLRGALSQLSVPEAFQLYLRKTYFKTGSLMANSCRAAAVLRGASPEVEHGAFAYGKHVGLAFQLVDDMLDFVGTEKQLGKPALTDLRQGVITAPLLFAAERFPHLQELIQRKFSAEGDLAEAARCVQEADGIEQTRRLACFHGLSAVRALAPLGPSVHRDALVHLVSRVVDRDR